MCTATISTLTLAAILQDPLIKLVMRSDNVSEQDHSELLYRVKRSLISRADIGQAGSPASGRKTLLTGCDEMPAYRDMLQAENILGRAAV